MNSKCCHSLGCIICFPERQISALIWLATEPYALLLRWRANRAPHLLHQCIWDKLEKYGIFLFLFFNFYHTYSYYAFLGHFCPQMYFLDNNSQLHKLLICFHSCLSPEFNCSLALYSLDSCFVSVSFIVLLNIPSSRSLISKVNKMNPPADPRYVPLISLLYPEPLNYLLSSVSEAFIEPTNQSFVQETV